MNPKAPVFPSEKGQQLNGVGYVPATGLTIRDYIAIEFYKAILSDIEYHKKFSSVLMVNPRYFAELSYSHADALIAESNKK